MFKSLIFSALVLILPMSTIAQSKFLDSVDETKKFSEGIVASIATGNMPGATKELRQVIIISNAEFDLFEAQLATQAGNFLNQIGLPIGYEFLQESRLGTNLVRQQFLVLHEKAAMRVNMVFYKTRKGWAVSHFFFDVNALTFFQ